jgi:hypothetical protein
MSTTSLKEQGTQLLYDGVPLTPDPQNATLSGVAALLADDRPAYVDLQPGDGTSYKFLLVPALSAPGAWSLPHATALDTVLVMRDPAAAHVWLKGVPQSSAALCTVRPGTALQTALQDAYPTPHARTVLSWWLLQLWARVWAFRGAQYRDTAGALRRDGRSHGIGPDDEVRRDT